MGELPHGYALKGQRCHGSHDWGARGRTNVLGALFGKKLLTDNAAFNKSKNMQEQIKQAGHSLEYLPAYSPDLNLIELKWAQAKSLRRNHSCDINTLFRDSCL